MKPNNRKNTSFKFSTIIIIMIITALISGLTAGVIVYTSYNKSTGINYNNVNNDAALKQFLEVYSSVTEDYYEDINKTEMLEAAIDAMLKYLDERYTSYLNTTQTNQLNDTLKGEYEGIGIAIVDHKIVDIFKNSPAFDAGMAVGDIIKSIDGVDVATYSTEEIVKKIQQSTGSNLSITVLRNGEPVSFNISTAKLYVPAISYKVIDNTNIGYIRLATFSSTVFNQVSDALIELNNKEISSLILDLRVNAGGYLDASEKVASLFLEKGKIIYSLETKKSKTIIKDKTIDKTEYPIVVLIDENTASAAEILAAALKESYGATIVGVKSYGKGKVQQVVSLIDGSMAKYTTGKWYTPTGTNVDKVGITPDYTVTLEIEKDQNGNTINIVDTQLIKAIDLLK